LIDSVLQIFDSLKVPLRTKLVDYASLERDHANEVLHEHKNVLLGPISNKTIEEEKKGICHRQILKELNIFASVTNAISIPGLQNINEEIDLLIIQQTDKGFTADHELTAEYDDVSSIWITPHKKSENIAQYAFNSA
jgi:isocitrate/isopropylmalate dehydrogenase